MSATNPNIASSRNDSSHAINSGATYEAEVEKISAVITRTKRLLLAGFLEERRHERDATQKARESQEAQVGEKRRFFHNTPLMLALVSTISVFANGLVAHAQAALADCAEAGKPCTNAGIPATVGSLSRYGPLVGIDEIDFDEVFSIGDVLINVTHYTDVREFGNRRVIVQEKPEVLLRRFEGKAFANLTRPDGALVWIKAAAISEVLDVEGQENMYGSDVKTALQMRNGGSQGVKEDAPSVLDRLGASAPRAKLTTIGDKSVWVRAELSHVSAGGPFGFPGSTVLEVDGRRIAVKESLAASRAILAAAKH
jgi:hypothetical protein